MGEKMEDSKEAPVCRGGEHAVLNREVWNRPHWEGEN